MDVDATGPASSNEPAPKKKLGANAQKKKDYWARRYINLAQVTQLKDMFGVALGVLVAKYMD